MRSASSIQHPASSIQHPASEDFVHTVEEAIAKLYQWQYGVRDADAFTFQLFTLLQLASPQDFCKLAETYPAEAQAYKLWYDSPDPVEFFKAHDAWKGPRSQD